MQTTSKLARAASFWFGASALFWLSACSGATHSSSGADGVSVSPASEARQGQTQIALSFSRASGGLSSPSRVDLEDLVVKVEPGSTDRELRLMVSVPHGAAPGWRSLSVDTSSGVSIEANVIDVTAITVDPSGQDSQLGTTSSPFRTIKQALSVAGSDDTCLVHDGQYDEQSGETWGYAVPEALTIIGDSASATTLQGPAHASPSADSADASAFEPSAKLAIQTLALADFDVALNATQPAQLALQGVRIRGRGKGIVVAGAASTIEVNSGSIDAEDYAVELAGTCAACRLALEAPRITGGIVVEDAHATVSIDGATLTGNGDNAALAFAGSTLDATSSTFSAGAAPYGIDLKTGTMTLTDVTVHGNQYAVYQLAGSSKLRRCKLDGYDSIGLYFASGSLDLGTATDAGDDSFTGLGPEAFGLYVDTNTTPLSCSNVSFDGITPQAGTVQAGTDLLSQPDEYILTPGKTISFYSLP